MEGQRYQPPEEFKINKDDSEFFQPEPDILLPRPERLPVGLPGLEVSLENPEQPQAEDIEANTELVNEQKHEVMDEPAPRVAAATPVKDVIPETPAARWVPPATPPLSAQPSAPVRPAPPPSVPPPPVAQFAWMYKRAMWAGFTVASILLIIGLVWYVL